MVERRQPHEHAPDTKGDTADQPYKEIVCFPILCGYQRSPIKQERDNQDGQDRFLEKVFSHFFVCHAITPLLPDRQTGIKTWLL